MAGSSKPKTLTSLNKPLSVMYVEVNYTNFRNISCYYLARTGKRLFDIAIIFAANINFDIENRRPVLGFNDYVTQVLLNPEKYIHPIQAQGTKVLLSVLGNHQGAGVCNFECIESIRDFARQLADTVNFFGLDGIDFDDEYSEYGKNSTSQPNDFSFLYLLRELRNLLPDKIISFYYFGPAAKRLKYNGLEAGDFLDYSWNAVYGSFSVPKVPKMDKRALGPAAVNVMLTSDEEAQKLAEKTRQEEYGVFLFYNLPNTDIREYLSRITTILYGSECVLDKGGLQPWPPQRERILDGYKTCGDIFMKIIYKLRKSMCLQCRRN